jgi:hypothetical protein
MKETNRANRVLAISSIATSALIALSVFVALLAMNREYQWNRGVEAFDLLRTFNRDAVDNCQEVMRVFPFHRSNVCMDTRFADSIYNADPKTDSAAYELRNRIMKMLNYLKAVCTAYELDVVDRDMVRREFTALFYRVGDCFDEFMTTAHGGYGVEEGPYNIIRKVLGEWKHLDTCEATAQTKTCDAHRLISGTWMSSQGRALRIAYWGRFRIEDSKKGTLATGGIKPLFCSSAGCDGSGGWVTMLWMSLEGDEWVCPAYVAGGKEEPSLTILLASAVAMRSLGKWFPTSETGSLTLTRVN